MLNSPLHSQSSTELELLETLLLADVSYPWNPADPDSQEYFSEREDEFILEDWPAEEISTRSQNFYNKLDNLWSSVAPTGPKIDLSQILQTTLKQHFALTLPPDWLNQIATSAVSLLDSPLSLGEKLIKCLNPLLPNLAEEDLQVLARPFAYAMRGNETPTPPQKPWTELSDIEKARFGLAVAHYALNEIENSGCR